MKLFRKYILVLFFAFPLTVTAQNFSVDSIEQTVASIEISGNLVQAFPPDIDVQCPAGADLQSVPHQQKLKNNENI